MRAGAGGKALPRLGPIDILFVCTGNICRSPMAEALLASRLASAGVTARVTSSGLLQEGNPASAHGVSEMKSRGLELEGHRSRRLSVEQVTGADLVLGLAREHVREVVLLVPPAWSCTFTLKELVRRADQVGARSPGQPFEEWLGKVHAGRAREDLLGWSEEDDVADPVGLGPADYRRTAEELDRMITRLVALGWGQSGTKGARA